MIDTLAAEYGLTTKDAGTLLALEDGDRLEYFFDVLSHLQTFNDSGQPQTQLGKAAGNW
jgi:aspartyl-tRNA(Asn)/glutamyl-tRNA(Gln) amidotransferase subunit B